MEFAALLLLAARAAGDDITVPVDSSVWVTGANYSPTIIRPWIMGYPIYFPHLSWFCFIWLMSFLL